MKRKSISLTIIPVENKKLKSYIDKEQFISLLNRFQNSVGGGLLSFSEERIEVIDGKFKMVVETYPNKNEVSRNISFTKNFKKGDNISWDILKEVISCYLKKSGEILVYDKEKEIFNCHDKKTRIILEINVEKDNSLFSENKLESFVKKETNRAKVIKELVIEKQQKTSVEIIPSFFSSKPEEKVSYEEEDEDIEVIK